MVWFLYGMCLALMIAIALLLLKVYTLHRAADEIRAAFAARLHEDTNVGIDVSTMDRTMRRLAADIDMQLKILRQKHIRYSEGDRELTEAITNIAHDLRTPLTAICGYMDLLEQEDVPENVRRYLQVISGRVDALKQLTEELFRYSVIVSAAPYEGREAVILSRALEECIAAQYGALVEKGITPEIDIAQAPVERLLNKAALSRILENILVNAIKYSDGDLRIVLSPDGTISFSNRASKLDEVSVGRLFDRFFTVESGQGSTGLGLSIAKILTEQMGGSIMAAVEQSVFTLRLTFPI